MYLCILCNYLTISEKGEGKKERKISMTTLWSGNLADKESARKDRMLRWSCGVSRMDRIRNKVIKNKIKVTEATKKIQEMRAM